MRSTGEQPQQLVLVDSLVNSPNCEQPPASFPVPRLELQGVQPNAIASFQLSSPQAPQPDANPLSSGSGASGRPSVSPSASGEKEKRRAQSMRKESFSTQVAHSPTPATAAAATDPPTYLIDPYYRTDSLANSERNWRESLRAELYRYEPEPHSRTPSAPRSASTGLCSGAKLRAYT